MLVEQRHQHRAAKSAAREPQRVIAGANAEIDAAAGERLHGRPAAVEIDDLGLDAFGLEQLLLDRDHDRDRGDRLLG